MAYGYILIPEDFVQPTEFKNSISGCLGFTVPYLQLNNVVIPDANGYDVTYCVYRTYNKTQGYLDVWMCI